MGWRCKKCETINPLLNRQCIVCGNARLQLRRKDIAGWLLFLEQRTIGYLIRNAANITMAAAAVLIVLTVSTAYNPGYPRGENDFISLLEYKQAAVKDRLGRVRKADTMDKLGGIKLVDISGRFRAIRQVEIGNRDLNAGLKKAGDTAHKIVKSLHKLGNKGIYAGGRLAAVAEKWEDESLYNRLEPELKRLVLTTGGKLKVIVIRLVNQTKNIKGKVMRFGSNYYR
ncbi:MAG TPA: Ran-binding zinc finger domain-containing protein [Clostridia bacterium]|nr:Ran-binding zinc finger domain-containing protein [Clostridia bacterium]